MLVVMQGYALLIALADGRGGMTGAAHAADSVIAAAKTVFAADVIALFGRDL